MRNLNQVLMAIFCFITLSASAAQEFGLASVYSPRFQGSRTASGEVFNHKSYSAAHRTLPFGTFIRITRTDNGRSVVVKINDRGPFVSERVTDISKAAASKLGISGEMDEVRVKIEVVNDPKTALGVSNPSPKTVIGSIEKPKAVPMPDGGDEYVASKNVEDRSIPREYRYVPTSKFAVNPKAAVKKNAPNLATPIMSGTPTDFDKTGLYAVKMNRPQASGFAVQVAQLSNHGNMENTVKNLQIDFHKNVLVNIVKGQNGATQYKVMLGPFDTQTTADNYLKSIKKKKMKGFVVDLKNFR